HNIVPVPGGHRHPDTGSATGLHRRVLHAIDDHPRHALISPSVAPVHPEHAESAHARSAQAQPYGSGVRTSPGGHRKSTRPPPTPERRNGRTGGTCPAVPAL